MYKCVCVYTHMCAYIYIYIHTYTDIYIYIYIYFLSFSNSSSRVLCIDICVSTRIFTSAVSIAAKDWKQSSHLSR